MERPSCLLNGSGDRIRTCDLRVMSGGSGCFRKPKWVRDFDPTYDSGEASNGETGVRGFGDFGISGPMIPHCIHKSRRERSTSGFSA